MGILCRAGIHDWLAWSNEYQRGNQVMQRTACGACGIVKERVIYDTTPRLPPRDPKPGDPDFVPSIDG